MSKKTLGGMPTVVRKVFEKHLEYIPEIDKVVIKGDSEAGPKLFFEDTMNAIIGYLRKVLGIKEEKDASN